MRKVMMTLVLPALAVLALASGCAATARRQAPHDALVACRAQADEHYRSRYVPVWQASVDACMEEASGR